MVRAKLHVWSESEDRSGAETGIAAIADNSLGSGNISGDSLRPLTPTNKLAAVYICQMDAGKTSYYPIRSRITSPKIAGDPYIFVGGSVADDNPRIVYDFRVYPLTRHLDSQGVSDFLTAYGYEEDEAGVAHRLNVVAVFVDKAIKPTVPPITHILHATLSGQTSAGVWVNRTLVESYSLGAGTYVVYGGKVVSPTGIAARLFFAQYRDVYLPLIPIPTEDTPNPPFNICPLGEGIVFEIPGGLPSLDILASATEAVDHVELYLQKIR